MKKTQKAALSILLVLALLTALPLTAMAEGEGEGEGEGAGAGGTSQEVVNDKAGAELHGEYAGNTAAGVTVATDGKVGTNTGSIGYNNGEVTNNGTKEGGVSSGTIDTNMGKVDTNYGIIDYVPNGYAKGFVGDNQGYIGFVPGGTVDVNNGTIDTVANAGTVNTNNDTIGNVKGGCTVGVNNGTIGTVTMYGTVGENNKDINSNAGTVTTNNINGTVTNTYSTNNQDEIIGEGSVGTNYGTVTKTDGKTYCGLQTVENVDDDVTTSLDDVEQNTQIDLTSYTREGYELSEYKLYEGGSGTEYSSTAASSAVIDKSNADTYKITISMPSKLELFWKKLAAVFTPVAATASSGNGGAEAVPTSYKPKYIGLGSVIFINEKGYKVLEIKDDAFVVASFDALSDEDVQDLDALFAKLFTAEQQKQIKNIGQLLDAKDVLAVFGKPGNHPVFEISKALVE